MNKEWLLALLGKSTVDYKAAERLVFNYNDKTKVISIGGQPIDPKTLDILREEANYLLSSRLVEILDATITNESAHLALIQSSSFEHVQFAKALFHWNHVLKNMLVRLTK